MAEEKIKEVGPKEEPKKSKWYLWACGGCGCLIIFIIIGFFAWRFFVSQKDTTPSVSDNRDPEDIAMSKEELVDYFVGETTVWPGSDKVIKIIKWDKPVVTVSIEDQAPQGGEKALANFISVFNANSSQTKLEKVAQDGDIKIYFQKDTHGAAGSSGPSSGADYIIDSANVSLSDKAAIFQESLESIMDHELMHAIGFPGHYQGQTCRLMSPQVCGSHLSINEENLIQMMYSSGISDELGESEIRAYFQNWEPK